MLSCSLQVAWKTMSKESRMKATINQKLTEMGERERWHIVCLYLQLCQPMHKLLLYLYLLYTQLNISILLHICVRISKMFTEIALKKGPYSFWVVCYSQSAIRGIIILAVFLLYSRDTCTVTGIPPYSWTTSINTQNDSSVLKALCSSSPVTKTTT